MDRHLGLEGLDAADAGAGYDTAARRVSGNGAGLLYCICGRAHPEMGDPVGTADLFGSHVGDRIEVANLAGKANAKIGMHLKPLNRPSRRLGGQEGRPE